MKPDVDLLLHVDLRLAAADGHEAVLAGLSNPAGHHHPEQREQANRDQPAGGVTPEAALDSAGDLHLMCPEVVDQIRIVDADGFEVRAARSSGGAARTLMMGPARGGGIGAGGVGVA